MQPRWLGDKLIFVSDRTNWWNLYLLGEDGGRPLCTTEAEFYTDRNGYLASGRT